MSHLKRDPPERKDLNQVKIPKLDIDDKENWQNTLNDSDDDLNFDLDLNLEKWQICKVVRIVAKLDFQMIIEVSTPDGLQSTLTLDLIWADTRLEVGDTVRFHNIAVKFGFNFFFLFAPADFRNGKET